MNQNQASAPIPVAQLREIDAICDRFERDWQSGQRPQVVDYLGEIPDPGRSELIRQLLDVEFEQRLVAADHPRAEEYTTQFPALAEWIKQRLERLIGMDPLAATEPSDDARDSTSIDPTDADDADDPFLGRTFGKYMIVSKLGAGGMGAVYHARHSMIQCERALKLLRPNLARNPDAIKRFLTEAQACVELTHPNIVTTFDVDQSEDGSIYLVMELLSGENLHELVSRIGRLQFRKAATIVQQVAAGLGFAHGRGTVHRDIKPHNIMWTEGGTAKILDLGLVRILEDEADPVITETSTDQERFDTLLTRFQTRLTNQQSLVGTLPYMSPEQAANARDADRQSDIYSLGCTFYYLLTGKHAFAGETPDEIVRKHLEADFTPVAELRPDVPASLMEILARMMSCQRDNRFQSALDVEESLRGWLGDYGIRPSVVPEPVDLDDLSSLRQALIRLRVVSEDDWKAAELATQDATHSTTMLGNQSVRVLQELQSVQNQRGDEKFGLSEFQIRHVLNGNLDVLRLPYHVLLDQVGRGWKGEVFKARNLEADRVEVVRTFSPRLLDGLEGVGKQRIRAFRAEVKRLASLDHPSIPPVYGGGSYENRLHGELAYLSAEFVEGATVADVVSHGHRPNGQPVDVAWALTKIRDVCRALQYAHEAGILHLDIHALSLKIDPDDQVQLLDLGVAPLLTRPYREKVAKARAWSARSRVSGSMAVSEATLSAATSAPVEPPPVGTAQVMPPEQWLNRQHISVATDVYNLGCTLFFMLRGRYPFEGDGALELMQKHLKDSPLKGRAARGLPKSLRPILETALAKSPGERFPTAQAMGDSLAALLESDAAKKESRNWLRRLLQRGKG